MVIADIVNQIKEQPDYQEGRVSVYKLQDGIIVCTKTADEPVVEKPPTRKKPDVSKKVNTSDPLATFRLHTGLGDEKHRVSFMGREFHGSTLKEVVLEALGDLRVVDCPESENKKNILVILGGENA